MTDLVPADQIERIVGVARHQVKHYARAVTATQTMYILHSQECVDTGRDLRRCRYSLALDNDDLEDDLWTQHCDQPVEIRIQETQLVPVINGTQDALDLGGEA